ncbi:MAG: 4-(cytidine 5'-diphospho)-2-C-methyl-D-erythritol kinase [Planctomycetota bacterium]|jgi:4-diphosphocytidyl-2-C-methyl-D-erythritol kinase
MTGKKQITTIRDGLLIRAPAKINLSLLIAGKRHDGFHEIETVMAKVDFFDEILFQKARKPGIELICQGPNWAPADKENLVYKACETLLTYCDIRAGIKITLTKNVPAGAGLGSASSDAAATLIGVNRFLQLGLDNNKLAELAPALGSDVAFFLDGPLALCTGRGEKIKKLEQNFGFMALLILPHINVSTEKVYASYTQNEALYEKLNAETKDLLEKNRIDLVAEMCTNMLQTSCFSLYEELAVLKAEAESLGIRPLCLSGSGSAMFCLIDTPQKQKAQQYLRKLEQNLGCKGIIVRNNRW